MNYVSNTSNMIITHGPSDIDIVSTHGSSGTDIVHAREISNTTATHGFFNIDIIFTSNILDFYNFSQNQFFNLYLKIYF